jgi:hypothetical protein
VTVLQLNRAVLKLAQCRFHVGRKPLLLLIVFFLASCGPTYPVEIDQEAHGKITAHFPNCRNGVDFSWGDGAHDEALASSSTHIYAYKGNYTIKATCSPGGGELPFFHSHGAKRTGVTTAQTEPPSWKVSTLLTAIAALLVAITGLIAVLRKRASSSDESGGTPR